MDEAVSLMKRIRLLEAENVVLRSRLTEFERSQQNAREQEQSVQAQAAELAKANEAMRRSLRRLANAENFDAVLEAFLSEAVTIAQANLGAVMKRRSGTEFCIGLIALDNTVTKFPETDPLSIALAAVTARDPAGVFKQVVAGEIYCQSVDDDYATWFPEGAAFHQQRGDQMIWLFPLSAGQDVIGYLDLTFQHRQPLSQVTIETLQALICQLTLTLEMLRLSEATQQTAISREREQSAQQRAAELAKANIVLRGAMSRLASKPSLAEFLEHVLAQICQNPMDAGIIMLYDANQDHLTPISSFGSQPPLPSNQPPIPAICLPAWERLMATKRAVMLDLNSVEFPVREIREWHQAQGHRRVVAIPLMVADRLLGLFCIAICRPDPLNEVELELFQTLSQQATIAIQLTQLSEEAQQAAILDERNRMARDIHDTLAQAFTGINIQLEATRRKLMVADLEKAEQHITHARNLATQGLAEARRSVRSLRPETLETRNLCEAIRHLAQQMTVGTDLHLVLHIEDCPIDLPAAIETNLLRIAQEAFTNSLKHAQATNICLELMFEPNAVHLRIQDNGQGFDLELLALRSGYGLVGIQERTNQLNGVFLCNSRIGAGTEITVTVPLSKPNKIPETAS